jgi:hypothetical protein
MCVILGQRRPNARRKENCGFAMGRATFCILSACVLAVSLRSLFLCA